ncbi:MAG: PepSY domain-containing protein [Patulibacter sp.]
MFRPRTITAAVLAASFVAGGSALVAAPALADDDLSHAQATKARAAALKQVSGRVIQIDGDDDDRSRYEVTVLTKGGSAREVHLDSRYRVQRTTRGDRDGLTYSTAGRASSAALKQVSGGIVVDIEVDSDDRSRYEVKLLTRSGSERDVHLDRSFRVVSSDDDD